MADRLQHNCSFHQLRLPRLQLVQISVLKYTILWISLKTKLRGSGLGLSCYSLGTLKVMHTRNLYKRYTASTYAFVSFNLASVKLQKMCGSKMSQCKMLTSETEGVSDRSTCSIVICLRRAELQAFNVSVMLSIKILPRLKILSACSTSIIAMPAINCESYILH